RLRRNFALDETQGRNPRAGVSADYGNLGPRLLSFFYFQLSTLSFPSFSPPLRRMPPDGAGFVSIRVHLWLSSKLSKVCHLKSPISAQADARSQAKVPQFLCNWSSAVLTASHPCKARGGNGCAASRERRFASGSTVLGASSNRPSGKPTLSRAKRRCSAKNA